MDVLKRRRARDASWAARSGLCVAGVVMLPACNALVGVDFGAAHLEDGGSTTDGRPNGSRDAGHARHDTGSDAHVSTKRDAHGSTDAAKSDSPTCNASAPPQTAPCVIDETYGVFVAPAARGGSDVTGTGTRAFPYGTVAGGISHAHGLRVYVCASDYVEQVIVTAANDGVEVYGGLACPPLVASDAGRDGAVDAGRVDGGHHDAGDHDGASADGSSLDAATAEPWTYTGAPAVVRPLLPRYALDVESLLTGVHFEDFAFVAQNANALMGSAASIAAMINASSGVSFARVAFTSGSGRAGSPGALPPSNDCPTSLVGGSIVTTTPGTGAKCTCPSVAGSSSEGGNGTPTTHVVLASNSGTSIPAATPVPPRDGLVGKSNAAGTCTAGDPGANGAGGTAGAAGLPSGALDATGWTAQPGGIGAPGDPGQGGGGGGSVTYGGAGGGAGGCGGTGGIGGIGGGASIAVAIVSSSVSFSAVTLTPAPGGAGGAGSVGLAGQAGGPGGPQAILFTVEGCAGGAGGAGGGGGGGGGGAGGPSLGIAWTGASAPFIDGASTASAVFLSAPSAFVPATGAKGGSSGAGGAAVAGGIAGAAGTVGPVGLLEAVMPL